MKTRLMLLAPLALSAMALPTLQASAAEEIFPKRVATPDGSAPEGFTIGRGPIAYNGSPNGSIYKVNLRTGQGRELTPVIDPDIAGGACIVLGLRVDLRTDYLFAAGCVGGNAYVYDTVTGALIMEYQLTAPGSVINDLTIAEDAVYFTDASLPFIYKLPLGDNGALPLSSDGVEAIQLPPEFAIDPAIFCCGANGIAVTPDGNNLIIGHSNLSALYRVNLATNETTPITLDKPLVGFIDGIAQRGRILYIARPGDPTLPDSIEVVRLTRDLNSGFRVRTITDSEFDGVASGALFRDKYYVNNARYSNFPGGDTEYWITKVELRPQGEKK